MTGEPGGRPAKVGIAMNDIAAGHHGALLDTRRLHQAAEDRRRRLSRHLTAGGGPRVDLSGKSAHIFGGGEMPVATGTRHRRSTPYQAYRRRTPTYRRRQQRKAVDDVLPAGARASPKCSKDPRFKTLCGAPEEHRRRCRTRSRRCSRQQPTEHWVGKLDAAGVPGGPVFIYDQALAEQHIAGAQDGAGNRPSEDRAHEDHSATR